MANINIALPVRERLNFGGYYSRAAERNLLFEAIVLTVADALNSASAIPAL